MEVWSHDGKLYEVNSWYCLPDDAWHYEVVGTTGPPGSAPYLAVVIPDATPSGGPFTPKHADHVRVAIAGGATPWPILRRLLELVESSGDIVEEHEAPSGVGDKLLSNNVWWYAGTAFEVSSFHVSDRDAWCYELCEVKPDAPSNNYVEVEIPEMAPAAAGPFIAEPADRVTLTGHGGWDIPWPIFRRFISAITRPRRNSPARDNCP